MKRIVFFVFLLTCCTRPPCYPEAEYPNYTQYNELPITGLDQVLLDSTTRNVVACLAPLKAHWLTKEEAFKAECYGTPTFEIRSCLEVRVAPDWYISKCSGEQVFPCNVPFASCAAKGQTPTEGCSCHCRAMIQDNTTIIVTPNLKLYPAYLTTLLTGCNNVWVGPLAECADPRQVK